MEKQFEKIVYEACLKSALDMGSRIKTMSWFGKNHAKVEVEVEVEIKLAA